MYLDYIAFFVWVVGFFFEALADAQKSAFKADLNNKGKFIDEGLWSISRHPNYFGEILMWLAVALSCMN
jgi:steroid 5-alpha reductase family enzyme